MTWVNFRSIREQLDVRSVLAHYSFNVKENGQNQVKICCPFHEDENPSCGINTKNRCLTVSLAARRAISLILSPAWKASIPTVLVNFGKELCLQLKHSGSTEVPKKAEFQTNRRQKKDGKSKENLLKVRNGLTILKPNRRPKRAVTALLRSMVKYL